MPYKRRRRIRRKPKRHISWYNRKYSALEMGAKALTGLNWVRKRLNTESKFHDLTTATEQSTTGTVTLLSGIDQGDTSITRSGRRVRFTKLNLTILPAIQGNSVSDVVRFVIVRANNDLAPTWAGTFTTTSPQSYRNLDSTRNVSVLYDKTFVLSTTAYLTKVIDINLIIDHVASWDIGTDTEANNHLFLLTCGQKATGTDATDSVMHSRLRFVDN